MFEHDRSASRGQMATRGLYVFEHASKLGNASAHALFDRISVRPKASEKVPRAFGDFEVQIDRNGLPEGVTLHEM